MQVALCATTASIVPAYMPFRGRNDLTLRIVTPVRVMLLAASICLVVGVQTRRPNALALGAGMGAWLIVAMMSRPSLERLRATRTHLNAAFESDSIDIALALQPGGDATSPGSGVLAFLEVRDEFPAGESFHIDALLESAFRGGQGVELRYRPQCARRRGLYVLGPVRVAATDPTGIFSRERTIPLFTNLLVHPAAVRLERFDPIAGFTLRHVGEVARPLPGTSQEFLLVRDYRPGDSPRRVHWPLSARHGDLMVREFEDATLTDIHLVLNLYRHGLGGFGDVTSEEALIAACASVLTHALEAGHRGALTVVSDGVHRTPLGTGSAHLHTLLQDLTLARGGGSGHFTRVVAQDLAAVRTGGTLIVASSASSFEPDLDEALDMLRLRGVATSAIIVDDRTYEAINWEQFKRRHAARPLSTVARDLTARGVAVFTLAKGSDLRERLELGLSQEGAA